MPTSESKLVCLIWKAFCILFWLPIVIAIANSPLILCGYDCIGGVVVVAHFVVLCVAPVVYELDFFECCSLRLYVSLSAYSLRAQSVYTRVECRKSFQTFISSLTVSQFPNQWMT